MEFAWENIQNFGDASKYLFNNKFLSDIDFQFSNNQILYGHSFLLSLRGVGFYTEYKHSFGLRKFKTVTNVSYQCFYKFLQHLYSVDNYEPHEESVFDIMQLAQDYKVYDLIKLCSKWLENEINLKNYLMSNVRKIMSHDKFVLLNHDTLEYILELPYFRCDIDEFEVFQAVINWAKESCKTTGLSPTGLAIRLLLGNMLYLIRFPIMSIDQFRQCNIIAPNLLNEKEVILIHDIISLQQKNSAPFLNNRRYERIIINKDISDKSKISVNFKSKNIIEFSTNKSIVLTGISLFMPKGEHELQIKTKHNKNVNYTMKLNSSKECNVYNPIPGIYIDPFTDYEICLSLKWIKNEMKCHNFDYYKSLSDVIGSDVQFNFKNLSCNVIEYLTFSS